MINLSYIWTSPQTNAVPSEWADFACSIPERYIDNISSIRTQFSEDVTVQLWTDFFRNDDFEKMAHEFMSQDTRFDGITLRSLHDIQDYKEDPLFLIETKPSTNESTDDRSIFWTQVDLAKFLVLQEMLRTHPDQVAVFSDMDIKVLPISSERFSNVVKMHDMVFSADKTAKQIGSVENQFMAFAADENGHNTFLDNVTMIAHKHKEPQVIRSEEDVSRMLETLPEAMRDTFDRSVLAKSKRVCGWQILNEEARKFLQQLDHITHDQIVFEIDGFTVDKSDYPDFIQH